MQPCPQCECLSEDDAKFCGECGSALSPAPEEAPGGCAHCHASGDNFDEDGFCTICGCQRENPRDSQTTALSDLFAAASDKGKRHHQNEDAFAIGACHGYHIAIVCDGVSSSQHPEEASRLAAEAAQSHLSQALSNHNGSANDNTLVKLIGDAIATAETAVQTLAKDDPQLDPPAATIVAAIVGQGKITLGWLGDSRAYFISEAGKATLLTRDHSWVNEQVDDNLMTYEEASQSRFAHTITKTLGGYHGTAEADEPSFTDTALTEPGWLLLCSDGLWNYAETPGAIEEIITQAGPKPTAQELASHLVQWANQQGGRDNITAIALKLHPGP